MRGCPADYDDWAKRGLPGWDYAGVLPYFRRSESNWRGASRFHGGTGPLTTARYETDDFIYPRIIDTAETLGFKHLEDFHAEDIEGFTVPDCNYHGGERASTVARYLRPAMSRANLEVRINTLTRALLLENGRCVGVQAESYGQVGGDPLRARSDSLRGHLQFAAAAAALGHRRAAGPGAAWHSRPARLARRGREPAGSPVAERRLRGQRRILLRQPAAARPAGAVGAAVEDVSQRHPRALADCRAGAGAHRAASRPARPADAGGAGVDLRAAVVSRLAQGRGSYASPRPACCCIRESRGKVSLRSADPRDKPKIQLNLLQAEADRAGLRNIVKFVRRFFATAPASELVGQEAHARARRCRATPRSMPGCAPTCAPPCIRPAPAPWARMAWRWWMVSYECTGCRDCASPMRR